MYADRDLRSAARLVGGRLCRDQRRAGDFFDGQLRDSEGLVPRNRANLLAWELVMAAVVFICVGFTWAALRLQQTY